MIMLSSGKAVKMGNPSSEDHFKSDIQQFIDLNPKLGVVFAWYDSPEEIKRFSQGINDCYTNKKFKTFIIATSKYQSKMKHYITILRDILREVYPEAYFDDPDEKEPAKSDRYEMMIVYK